MSWLSYIFPQTIFRTSSRYNRDIRINQEHGRYKLLVNGARESGEYIEELWRFASIQFDIFGDVNKKNILILGIAGGTLIHMLHDRYSKSKIVGVDIDQTMIDIGKNYFDLDAISNFECVCVDAKIFIKQTRKTFDLIIVDLFIGPDVPDFVISLEFEKHVKRSLTKNGSVLINYLRQPGYEERAEKLKILLKRLYKDVAWVDRYNNRFFYAKIA